jgi:nitrate reductase delta subunit
MTEIALSSLTLLAEALAYPTPKRVEALQTGLEGLPPGEVRQAFSAFFKQVIRLSMGEWEELYTQTWDLSPLTIPYIGFQIWGEGYQRGNFMSTLSHTYAEYGLDPAGELPDHLNPVLRYLEAVPTPLPELCEVLKPALQKMQAVLKKNDPHNPYLELMQAILLETQPFVPNA